MSTRTTALAIALLTLFGLACFTPQTDSPAVTTRLGLTLSIVENGVVNIDRFAPFTEDKAFFEGHYYAEKAPGLSLMGVPPVAAARLLFLALGWPTEGTDWGVYPRYALAATLTIVGLMSAATAAAIYLIALRLGASNQAAIFGSFVIAIGSPYFFWSTTFVAHVTAGSLILFALGMALLPRRHGFWSGGAVGVLAGLAVTVDFTMVIVLGVSGVLLLALTWRPSTPGAWSYLGGILLGGILGVLPLLIYNVLAFGSPFHIGYANVVGFDGMKQGLFGIGWPKMSTLYEILFGSFRGLRQFAPILVLVPIGLAMMMLLSPTARNAAFVISAVAVSVVLINSGYYYWEGGWSAGPRHIVSMLPVLGVAMAFVWPKRWWLQLACVALLIPGLFLAALVPTVTIFTPSNYQHPLEELYLPALPQNWQRMMPMLLVWANFGWLMWQARGTLRDASPTAPASPA